MKHTKTIILPLYFLLLFFVFLQYIIKTNMTHTLTQEQKNALKLGINISLSANAGAGKTYVLVERYIKLLQTGKNVNEIVAITFTKKAANEMIERIADRLDKLIEDAAKNNNDVRHYKKMRRQLSNANISTIHSFCLNILKDYTIEANLEPNFRELTDIEKYSIINDSIDMVLEDVIVDNDETATKVLFTYYNRRDIVKILNTILNKPDLENTMKHIDSLTFEEWNKQIIEEFFNQTKNEIEGFIEYVSEAMYVFNDVKFKTTELEQNAYTLLNELLYCKGNVSADNFEKIVNIIIDVCNISINGIIGRGVRYFIPAFFKLCFNENEIDGSAYRKKILEKIEPIKSNQLSLIHFELNKILFAIYQKIKEKINERKAELNGIDFDDMLIKTRDLLVNNKNIATAISNQYKEIMIDEFQDTNQIQYDIIKALVPTIDVNERHNEVSSNNFPNVFIVGDVKQSIYRFRNADVKVFKEAINNIEDSNKNSYGTLALTTTFRTLPVVTGFVNMACNHLGLYENKDIHELVCGRKFDNDKGSINFLLAFKDTEGEPLTTIDTINSQQENDNINIIEDDEAEAKLIAKTITDYVNENNDNKYSDFAILYKSRTHINKLKTIFNSNNIPFIEEGNTGFWNAPEIKHILNYLNFLNNPNNDIYCVGTLVSPFFSFSDTDLLEIQYGSDGNVWENIIKICNTEYNMETLPEFEDYLQELVIESAEFQECHNELIEASNSYQDYESEFDLTSNSFQECHNELIEASKEEDTEKCFEEYDEEDDEEYFEEYDEEDDEDDDDDYDDEDEDYDDDIEYDIFSNLKETVPLDQDTFLIDKKMISLMQERTILEQRFLQLEQNKVHLCQKQIKLEEQKLYQLKLQQKYKLLKQKYFKNILVLLNLHIELSENVSITHLINIILNNRSWTDRLKLLTEQSQKIALNNIEKFVSKARDFQSRGYVSLNDFMRELNKLQEIDSIEGDGFEDSEENAVKFLTIHKSKGLEFKNVILYNLSAQPRNIMFPLISKKYGLGMSVPSAIKEDFLMASVNDISKKEITSTTSNWRKMEDSLAGKMIKKEEKIAEDEELLRLLYVGMTRAKDNLYLSGIVKKDKNNKNTLFAKLLDVIGYNFDNITDFKDKKHNKIEINYPAKILNAGEINIDTPINIYSFCDDKKITSGEVAETEDISSLIENIPSLSEPDTRIPNNNVINDRPQQQDNIDSINNIDSIICKHNYNAIESNKMLSFSRLLKSDNIEEFIANRFGINIYDIKKINSIDEHNAINNNSVFKLSGTEKGTLYHNIMEQLKEWYIDGEIKEEILKSIIANSLDKSNLLNDNSNAVNSKITNEKVLNDISKSIIANIKALMDSDFMQNYKNYFKDAMFEYEIHLPYRDNFLYGIIDCLIKNDSDEYEIWDWKTNAITDINELKVKYELQMLVYIYLLMYLYPNQKRYIARLISTELIEVHSIEKTKSDLNNIDNEIKKIIDNTLISVVEY